MRANQIGGPSRINVIRMPQANPQLNAGNQSSLRPPGATFRLGESSFEDRAEKYQQDLAEFNLGQREDELTKRKSEAEEVASGRNMLNGRAVTRAEMDQYLQGLKSSSRNNPLMRDAQYMAARGAMTPAPTREANETQETYSARLQEYLSPANKQRREEQFNKTLSQYRSDALGRSINQFQNDPMGYLLGGGQDYTTYSPDALMSYLGQANQLSRAVGQGRENSLLGLSSRVYRPGTSYASQGFTPETAKASLGMESSPEDEMRQYNLDTFQRAAPGTNF